jgi:CubicO group peptidase (beta-lactamase class C family)
VGLGSLALAGLLLWTTVPIAGRAQELDRVDAYVHGLAAAGQLSGTLLVAEDGRVVYEKAFGMADYELGVPNTVATEQGIASVSKLLTAIVTLRLAEDGVLDLDDPMSDYIADFPRGDEITVDQLLRHRSGIPHRVLDDDDLGVPRSAADMVELARHRELLFAPGTQRSYSSAGYSVLARVLEKASGCPYAELLEREVLEPAGAVHTTVDDGWNPVPERSRDYLLGAGPVPAPRVNLSFLVGAGSTFSTARDLYLVLRALDEGRLGSLPRSELLGDEGRLTWNGQTFGYRAFVDRWAEHDRTVVFAGNLQTGAVDLVRRDVPRILDGEEVAPPALPEGTPVRLDAGVTASLEGVYQFRAGEPDSEETLTFSASRDHAILGSWVLVPVSETRFISTTDYGSVEVVRGEGGAVEGLRWSKDDDSFFLPRVEGSSAPAG